MHGEGQAHGSEAGADPGTPFVDADGQGFIGGGAGQALAGGTEQRAIGVEELQQRRFEGVQGLGANEHGTFEHALGALNGFDFQERPLGEVGLAEKDLMSVAGLGAGGVDWGGGAEELQGVVGFVGDEEGELVVLEDVGVNGEHGFAGGGVEHKADAIGAVGDEHDGVAEDMQAAAELGGESGVAIHIEGLWAGRGARAMRSMRGTGKEKGVGSWATEGAKTNTGPRKSTPCRRVNFDFASGPERPADVNDRESTRRRLSGR